MPIFKLTEQQCQLSSVQLRKETHGEELVKAITLKFKTTMPNTVLDYFSDELRETYFRKSNESEEDLAEQGGDDLFRHLKFTEIKNAIDWSWKGTGYRMIVPVGISGEQDVILINSDIKDFKFKPKEGGSVEFTFNVNAKAQKEDIPWLFEFLLEDVTLTLQPPSAEQLAQMKIDATVAANDDDAEERPVQALQ